MRYILNFEYGASSDEDLVMSVLGKMGHKKKALIIASLHAVFNACGVPKSQDELAGLIYILNNIGLTMNSNALSLPSSVSPIYQTVKKPAKNTSTTKKAQKTEKTNEIRKQNNHVPVPVEQVSQKDPVSTITTHEKEAEIAAENTGINLNESEDLDRPFWIDKDGKVAVLSTEEINGLSPEVRRQYFLDRMNTTETL